MGYPSCRELGVAKSNRMQWLIYGTDENLKHQLQHDGIEVLRKYPHYIRDVIFHSAGDACGSIEMYIVIFI